MAKIGIEVEGRLRGVKTLFVDAQEVLDAPGVVANHAKNYGLSHIYISDNNNQLDYNQLGKIFNLYHVTLDVTKVHPDPRPTNLTIMLSLPKECWDSVERLRPDDQFKFQDDSRNILVGTARNLIRTQPIEFLGDEEL